MPLVSYGVDHVHGTPYRSRTVQRTYVFLLT